MIYYYLIVIVAVVWAARLVWRNHPGTTPGGAIAASFWRFVGNIKQAGSEKTDA